MTPRRARLVLVLVVMGVVGVAVVAWEPVYWLIITQKIPIETPDRSRLFAAEELPDVTRESSPRGVTTSPQLHRRSAEMFLPDGLKHRQRGYMMVRRSTRAKHGWYRLWYEDTGMLAYQCDFRNGEGRRETIWAFDGRVASQAKNFIDSWDLFNPSAENTESPWWWNATDQTTPSIPAWMKDDVQWQRALDAQD